MNAVELVDDAQGLFAGEDGGKPFGTFGGGEQHRFDLFVEDFAVKEEDGGEGLVSPAPTTGAVWVEAATLRCTVRWLMKSWISGAPISAGWRLL